MAGERPLGSLVAEPDPASARGGLAVGGLVFLIALLVRVANASSVFTAYGPQVGPFDELYHVARIVFSGQNPGHVLSFDPNRGLHGAFCPWPPLYDVSAGVAARILGAQSPNAFVARAVWFPPLVSAAFAALVAAWMTRRGGQFAGFLAGAGVAVSFPYLEASQLGDIDHHFLEPPLLFGILAATALLGRARGWRAEVRAGAVFGAALCLALFVQTALLFAAAVALLGVLLLPRSETPARRAGALGFGVAALAVWIYRLAQPAGYPGSSWYLGSPHAAALFAASVASAVSAIALSRRASVLAALLLSLVLGGLAGACIPGMIENVIGGVGFFRGDPWLRTIVEFQPLFFQGWSGAASGLCRLGGGVLFLGPLAVMAFRRRDVPAALVSIFGGAYLLATLNSSRFAVCAGPLLAVAGALVISDWTGDRVKAVASALFLLGPSLWLSVPLIRMPQPVLSPEVLTFYRTAGTLRTSAHPGQRVLAPWTWGHVFEFVGAQAPVVDGFGSSTAPTEFDDALNVELLPREDHVADYCRRSGIRYVVLQNPLQRLTVQAQAIGLSPDFFVRAPKGERPRILPLMRFSFWWRAYFDRGGEVREPTRFSPAFRRFRLIYADSQAFDGPSRFRGPAVQVWERIEP